MNVPLNQSTLLNSILQDFIAELSSEDCSSSLYPMHYLLQLQNGTRKTLYISLLDVIHKLTCNYYLFGNKVMFTEEVVLSLVEIGFCPLSNSKNILEAAIVEPIIAWSCLSFFKKTRPIEQSIRTVVGQLTISPTSVGIFWELVLIPAILEYFNCNDLSKHEYFKDKDIPSWLKGARFDRSFSAKEPSSCDAFHPARHDVIARVIDCQSAYHAAVLQFKKPKVLEAIETTDLETHEPNESIKKRKLEKELVTKFSQGILCILFLYPFKIHTDITDYEEICNAVDEEDVLIFLEQATTPTLFTTETWKFLEIMSSIN